MLGTGGCTKTKGGLHMDQQLIMDRAILAAFCRRHGIRRLSLFGSRLKGQSHPGSDMDLLVEFEQGHVPGFIGLAGMERELSDLMGGKKIDLRTPADLSRYFRDEVLTAAEVQYAE
jgi:predicted nucleotidyltransferase